MRLCTRQALDYSDTLYQIDWLKLSIPNRKYLLLMMIGSHRKVNVRAGGAYELNLSLFLQVSQGNIKKRSISFPTDPLTFQIMKTTATMCAVLRAI